MNASRPMSQTASSTTPPPHLLRLGLGLSFLLMLIALGVFAFSLRAVQNGGDTGTVIEVTATGCRPDNVAVTAGRRTFTIVNRSARAIEWEIIDGVMVLAERENIAPDLHQLLNVDLAPGDYTMTCGLLSNPHGQLHVAASGNAGRPRDLAARDFVGPLAEYRVYTTLQLRQLKRQASALQQAIDAGDLDAARAAYLDARRTDQRLAMPIGLFGDLDQRLNARADYFVQREADPDFRGFQRLALSLFERHSVADLHPVAEQLVEDIDTLARHFEQTSIPPAQLANGSARVLQAWHDHQANAQALTPLAINDLTGLTEGSAKIIALMKPLLQRQAPEMLKTLDRTLVAVQQDLDDAARHPRTDGPGPDGSRDVIDSNTVPVSAAKRLVQDSEALARSLSAINRALALSG